MGILLFKQNLVFSETRKEFFYLQHMDLQPWYSEWIYEVQVSVECLNSGLCA